VALMLDYAVHAGGEVHLNYGVRPSDEFLLHYAWAPPAPSQDASLQVLLERLPVAPAPRPTPTPHDLPCNSARAMRRGSCDFHTH